MKISISDEKKQVDEQRRLLDEQIADFHRYCYYWINYESNRDFKTDYAIIVPLILFIQF